MRTGLSTIQQTLTPEAASVLNHSIADAGRRGHSQTTPLHVASTLLSSSNGYLRQACIRSHPNSSHPLQCRALELCFTVALERLPAYPASQSVVSHDPPVSNALLAALKRAQAHQRRGCPEQQQQPLLAVKVELEQLVISILDDPSVSRVMREASFSSPVVKATIEQTLTATSSNSNSQTSPMSSFGLSSAVSHRHTVSRNSYLNPRLQASGTGIAPVDRANGEQRPEEVKKIVEILSKRKKRNPILVGDHEPEAVMKELMQRIERKEIGEEFRGLHVFSLEKELSGICSGKREEKGEKQSVAMKFRELGDLIESKIGGGVVLNLGDLKWLVEHRGGAAVSGVVQEVIAEMARLLSSHGREWKLWLIGTATCETYLRCQVYYPSMENDWDLQAVPIASRVRPTLFLRNENNGVHSSSDIETVSTLKSFPRSPLSSRRGSENNGDSARKMICCPACMDNYEKELGNLVAKEFEISNSDSKPEELQLEPLSQWLRLAKPSVAKPLRDSPLVKDQQEQIFRQKTEELQRKWVDTCTRLHPGFRANIDLHKPVTSPISSPVMSGGAKAAAFANPRLFRPVHQPIQHKMPLTRSINLQLFPPNPNLIVAANRKSASPPRSPVRTDLVLGRITPVKAASPVMDAHRERVKESNGCSLPQQFVNPYSHINADVKISCSLDGDSFKRLFKGLTQKVDWQSEAATAVAAAVTKSKSGEGKQRAVGAKGDTWLLFLGPDKVGKKKMAIGLSELVFGNKPVCIRLGSSEGCEDDEECGGVVRGKIVRGKTVVDRVVDAVRRNPFSVVVLEDVDQADSLMQSKLVGAMEKGRLPDSHGREVGLGSVIFIMTANWMPDGLRKPLDTVCSKEEKLSSIAASSCRPLQLVVVSCSAKRRPLWLEEEEAVCCTAKKPSLGIDLNLSAEDNDVVNSGSRNSSELTFETSPPTLKITPTSSMKNISNAADEAVVFSPVDFVGLSNKVSTKLAADFAAQFSEASFKIQTAALDQIVAGLWFNPSSNRLDDLHSWTDRALAPALRELRSVLVGGRETLVRLEVRNGGDVVDEHRPHGNWLPEKITVSRVG